MTMDINPAATDNLDTLVLDYYVQRFRQDLADHFRMTARRRFKCAEPKGTPSPAPKDPELLAAHVCHLAVAERAILDEAGRDVLDDFLAVNRLPLLISPCGERTDPRILLRTAGLPGPDGFAAVAPCACENIFKAFDQSLSLGKPFFPEGRGAAYEEAASRLAAVGETTRRRVAERYYATLKEFTGPAVKCIRGSILGGDRYGLDGVVVFRRISFNGLRMAAKDYVSRLDLLEEEGPLRVYASQKEPLRTVIVYDYVEHQSAAGAADIFGKVLDAAERHGVRRLGMNGLELLPDACGGQPEGRAMVALAGEALAGRPFDEVWFIDLDGGFNA